MSHSTSAEFDAGYRDWRMCARRPENERNSDYDSGYLAAMRDEFDAADEYYENSSL